MFQTLLTHTPLLYLVQSLWRDEAFSIFAAERPISFILTKLGFEPPVYYLMLHFWIKLFGQSEIAARSLSFLGLVLATIIIVEWSATLFKKHWLSYFTPIFFILNPMLLYYGFEVRTYGWYIFFATAALFTYQTKRWGYFTLVSILGFYTHTYFLFHLCAIGVHWILFHYKEFKTSWKKIIKGQPFRSFVIVGIAALPWIAKIVIESSKLQSSWYFPVDMQLVKSALGNMFTGYEGTPWYGWKYTKYLSILLAGFAYLSLRDKQNRSRNVLFILGVFIPLLVVIGISFHKPLFVNRYLISVTVSQVLVVCAALFTIKNSMVQKIAATILGIFVLWFNWWFPPQHPKLPIRDTISQINEQMLESDVILASDSLIFLETRYYAKDRNRTFLYNPNNNTFPWYVGDAVVTARDMVRDVPVYPSRGFLVHGDATYSVVYQLPIIKSTQTPKTP